MYNEIFESGYIDSNLNIVKSLYIMKYLSMDIAIVWIYTANGRKMPSIRLYIEETSSLGHTDLVGYIDTLHISILYIYRYFAYIDTLHISILYIYRYFTYIDTLHISILCIYRYFAYIDTLHISILYIYRYFACINIWIYG